MPRQQTRHLQLQVWIRVTAFRINRLSDSFTGRLLTVEEPPAILDVPFERLKDGPIRLPFHAE